MNVKKIAINSLMLQTLSLGLIAPLACSSIVKDQHPDLANLKGQGSSSVLSIMYEINDVLTNFQYEHSGSGDGLKVGTKEIKGKDFGMTSSLKHPQNASQWINTRTVTWAIDAIGIALKMPPAIASQYSEKKRPIVLGDQLGMLYDNNPQNDQSVTWETLLDGDQSNLVGANQKVVAYGRSGGKSSSGTADGFFHKLPEISGLSQEDLDSNHQYLAANILTAEPNASALNALIFAKSGGLTYLSLGFALKQEKASDQFRVATIKMANKDELWVPSLANIESKAYRWTRPFNIVYDVTNEKAVKFADFLLTNVQEILEQFDLVRLSSQQIKDQTEKYSLTTPDQDIVDNVANVETILGLDV